TGCKRDAAGRSRCRPRMAMITDLFVALSGSEAAGAMDAVPPACRTSPSAVAIVTAGESERLLEFPTCRPRVPARHLLPSLSVLTDRSYSVRFEVSVRLTGRWTSWVATATLGSAVFAPLPAAADGLTCDVDVYATT